MKRRTLFSIFAVLALCLMVAPLAAGTFRRTTDMDVYYAFGVHDWDDFDLYEANGWVPYAEVTMYDTGILDALDTQSGQTGSGTYDKQGKNLDLDVGPYICYSGQRVSRSPTIYEGVIIYNGSVAGLWRGYVQ